MHGSSPVRAVLQADSRIHLYDREQPEPIPGILFLQAVPKFDQQFAEVFGAAMQCHLSGNAELQCEPTATASSRKSL